MKNKTYGIIAGLAVMALTVFLYTILVDGFFQTVMAVFCLGTVLISQIIALACYAAIEKPVKQLTLTAVFTVHALLMVIASFVFINVLPLAYTGFWVVYAVSMCVAVLAALFICGTAGDAGKSADALKEAKNSMLNTRAVVNSLINTPTNAEYSELLNQLDEDLRFSDDSVISPMDASIHNSICQLAQNMSNAEYDVSGSVESIRAMIRQRNFTVKNTKANR